MQAQALRIETNQDVLTAQQSLQSIQTLLRAGLGCITYLRNLLPADNFSESYLTSANTNSLSSQPSGSVGSFASDCGRRSVSGFKIMTVTRGYTEEADKLLEFMENGIFDALQKQYLRSFIFAIYLDGDDPNNIVEAYTFNFHYHAIPGTTSVVPVMSLGDDLMKLSLSGKKADPVADASKKGKIPTLGEVKRSLKSLIKNLIQATTQMDALPKRRYATFKLFYYDHTPDDYEPPHFRAGDLDKDKWFFTTHGQQEVPEKCSIGQVQTGWHGVDVRVASVSGYLPSLEDNNAPFLGTTSGNGPLPPPLTPTEEAVTRAQQVEIQKKDANERRVVWDAEDGMGDADGEYDDDSDDSGSPSQVLETWRMGKAGLELVIPMGLRNSDGSIVPLPAPAKTSGKNIPESLADAHYVGAKENVPTRVGELVSSVPPPGSLAETQQIAQTQLVSEAARPPSPHRSRSPSPPHTPTPRPARHRMSTRSRVTPESPLPSSDVDAASIPSVSSYPDQETMETQDLKELLIGRRGLEDSEEMMLNMETQIDVPLPISQDDSLQSFSSINPDTQTGTTTTRDVAMEREVSDIIECECGVTAEDCDSISCDGGCRRWFHVWCMGYHNAHDKNMPLTFVCFDCRVRADQNWDLIMVHDLYPRMMERFRDLALFRRAIKVYEKINPNGLSAFSKLIGCESIVAGQLFKRLEAEGFIVQQFVQEEDSGFMETTMRRTRAKGRGAKPKKALRGKTMQRSKYVFEYSMQKNKEFCDYFTPTPEVERTILGLADLKPARKGHSKHAREIDIDMDSSNSQHDHDENMDQTQDEAPHSSAGKQDGTQTQDETQILPVPVNTQPTSAMKRKSDLGNTTTRTIKKMKISVGPAVDLGD
ncbi:unnamed protein product [Somion occarium]|uniref:HORMA domain-containing protein n=1 Tax=Somion occarium TaxID=3059160 RepID=A0ABP1DI70_9APHY